MWLPQHFVTPEHVVPQILEALLIAAKAGLRLPLVYNTGVYDSLESMRLMEGAVDIYMPGIASWFGSSLPSGLLTATIELRLK